MPAYSASKAALNVFTLCLRDQLQNSNVAVIEISPPAVQSMPSLHLWPRSLTNVVIAEIHLYMGEEICRKLGMPLDTFADLAIKGLLAGQDQIVIGSIGPAERFNAIVDQRRAAFKDLADVMRAQQI